MAHCLLLEVRLACIGLQFLTRIPVPAWVGFEPAWLTQCVRHFPLLGAVIGGLGAAVLAVVSLWWPPLVAALLCVAFTTWITAAFHEDGLADTFDALMGWAPRERALEIMKDSRIGSYGAVALLAVWGLRVALLAALLEQYGVWIACGAWVAAHMLARALSVVLMVVLPYGGDADHAKAKPLALEVPTHLAFVALLWCLPLAWLPISLAHWGLVLCGLIVLGCALTRWYRQRLGGFTGDGLGAAEQIGEVVVLLGLCAALPASWTAWHVGLLWSGA